MGHLSTLLWKNWILWKRNCFCSTCELLLPLLLIFALIGIRQIVDKKDVDEISFLTPLQVWKTSDPNVPVKIDGFFDEAKIDAAITAKFTNYTFTNLNLHQKLQKLTISERLSVLPKMKNCIDRIYNERMWRNGDIALGPQSNPIVQKLAYIFEQYYIYTPRYFQNNTELDDYVRDGNYGTAGKNSICLGVIFSEETTNTYEYSLRFNNSGQLSNEIPSTSFQPVNPINLEDQDQAKEYWASGMMTVQNIVDNLILQQEKGDNTVVIEPSFSYVRRAKGIKDDFPSYLRGAFGIYLILPLMIIYLRMTFGIIYEKEKKLREGMKMMGLNNTSFYLSWIIQYLVIYTLISILATILLKAVVFPHTNWFILFLNYWLFCVVLIFQSMFISVFFTQALFGLIVAIVWYLMMYLVISLLGSGDLVPEATYWGASISSHAAFSFSFDVMVLFEAQGKGVTFSELSTKIENYSVSIALIMHIVNIVFYFFMAVYLDLVFPNEWGKKKHPLFCIPYFNRKQEVSEFERKQSEIINHQERYEEVDQSLKDQETRKETLKINGLYKIYPNGKAAVTNVNLQMYTGQIYALLGHNGAGKTTTISMLTGLLDITQGNAEVYGLDVETQIDQIRGFMGVCPQHDILFDNLTVKEHLEMFATFKGMKTDEIPAAVRRMIEDVDLLDKTDYLSKNLSGGQKRRLSVAIAFIGNSKLIYLDEPTSGMDTSARRYIWEMLKNYKEDRIIVLTTHFMDEADFLGDRIGIMGEGKLICSGSSVFLKNQFGSGYNLTIVKESTLTDSDPIISLVKSKCVEANLLSKVSAEILFQLPMSAIKSFPTMFDELDKNSQKLNISSYGISITTLEEVFLKVAEIGAGHHQVKDVMEQEDQNQQMAQIDDFDINKIRITSSFQLFLNHTLALLIKRSRYFKRDLRSLCCEIFLPCLVVLAGLALMTIQFITDPNNVELIPTKIFDFAPVQYGYTGVQNTQIIDNLNSSEWKSVNLMQNANLQAYDLNYFHTFNRLQNVGWFYLSSITSTSYEYTLFCNSVFRDGPILMLNQMNQAILRTATNDPGKSIYVINRPFVRTYEEMNSQNIVSGFLAALVFSIGMAFIPASVISYIVKEREINIKHQQLVSGVSVKAYWFSNWLMDLGKHIIPSIVCCLLILAFNVTSMIDDGNYGAMWIIFFLYGWSIIPFCYLFSFAFKLQGNAMLLNFFLHLVIGSIISLVIYILRIIPSTRSGAKAVSWVLRLIPSFSFAYGIVNACSRTAYKTLEGYDEIKGVYDIDIAGGDILMMALEGVLYTFFVFVIEYFEDNGQLQKLGSKENEILYTPKQLDDDVEKERIACETEDPANKAILVKDLRKVFVLSSSVHKVAVDKVSFSIDHGEVFGLLGVNGAGKTTTFKILSGELKPTSGHAWVAGKSVINDLEAARVNIGYCPQFDALLENLTVREHLELFSDIKGIPYDRKEELVVKKLHEMDLMRFEHIQSGQLSGGNRRKLSVAIAMIGNPPIVFLDEPSTGMDPEARRFMWNVISRIATQRKQSTIILTTHSMEEAEALSTKIAIQVEGNLRCLGSVQHIKSKFGKGYEIETKMERPSHDEVNNLMAQVGLPQGARLNIEQTAEILKKLNQEALNDQIHMRGFGSHIYNDLRKPNGLAVETLIEFVLVENMGFALMQFIGGELGNFEIIEHFQSFYRFRLTVAITVGKLFGAFENHKKQLRISQYSIKQASIEQIFNNFATQQIPPAEPQNIEVQIPVGDQEMLPLK